MSNKKTEQTVKLEEHGIMDPRKSFNKDDAVAVKGLATHGGLLIAGSAALALGLVTKSAVGGFQGLKATGGYLNAARQGMQDYYNQNHPKKEKVKKEEDQEASQRASSKSTPENS